MSSYQKVLAARKRRTQLLACGGIVQKFDLGGIALPGNPMSNPFGGAPSIPMGGGMTDGFAGMGVGQGWDTFAANDPTKKAQITSLPNFATAPSGLANPFDQGNPTVQAMQQQGVHADMSGANAANTAQLGMGAQAFGAGQGAMGQQLGTAGQLGSLGTSAFGSGQGAMGAALGTAGNMNAAGNTLMNSGQGALGQQLATAGQFGNVYGGQQGLANSLQQQAMGQGGPGQQLAQSMLQQATQNNIAQGAGQIASVKGLNPALAARMIGDNTANQNQQAAMQGTQMGLQNQLNAQNQLGNLYGQMGQTLGAQSGAYGNAAGLGLGTGSSLMSNAGSLQGQAAGQGLGTGSSMIGNAGSLQGQAASTGMGVGSSMTNAGSGQAGTNALGAANINLGSQGQQLGALGQYNGQQVQGQLGAQQQDVDIAKANMQAKNNLAGGALNAAGGIGAAAMAAAHGMMVPGSASVPGDSPRNDTVNAKLSPGEIVIPRSITEHEHAPYLAAEFVRKALMGKGPKPQYEGGKRRAYDGTSPIGEDDDTPMITTGDATSPSPTDGTGAQLDWMSGKGLPNSGELGNQIAVDDSAPNRAGATGRWPAGATGSYSPDANSPNTGLGYNPNTTNPPGGNNQQQPNQSTIPNFSHDFEGYLRQKMGANDAMAAAQKTESDNVSKIMQDSAAEQQLDTVRYNKRLQGLDQEQALLTQAYMNGKIDPQRMWHNADTGNKIGAAIGILLSGIGSGLTGQPNMAMGVINKMIDQDIDAQRSDLGKQHSLLEMNLQKYGRLDQAMQATRIQKLSTVQAQIAQQAAQAKGPMAKAQAQSADADIGMQLTGMRQDLAWKQAFYDRQGGGGQKPGSSGVDLEGLRLGSQVGAISHEDSAAANKEAGQYMEMTNKITNIGNAFDKVSALQNIDSRLMSPRESARQIEMLTNFASDLAARDLDGRVNPVSLAANQGLFQKLLDDPKTGALGRQTMINAIKAKYSFPTLIKNHLVNPADPNLTITNSNRGSPTGR